jgi:sulfide:quinone oxidoreductase
MEGLMKGTASKTIIVLGGGMGGLTAANELRKKLPRQHRVVLIERSRRHLYPPTLLWLMVGERTPESIGRDLRELLLPGIEVIQGEVESLVPELRRVVIDGAAVSADYLVISVGAEMAPDMVPNLASAGHNLYTPAGATSLRDALAAFRGGKLVMVVSKPPYRCPAAPYEAAMLLEHYFRKRGLREKVTIEVYAAEPGPMGVAGPEVSAAVRGMITQKGIRYFPNHHLDRVNQPAQMLYFQNGRAAQYDLLAFVAPHRVPRLAVQSGLASEGGWIGIDRHTMETRFPGVFAIGDITEVPLKVGKPLPKAGVFAQGQAVVVAHNIAVAVTGQGAKTRFDGHGECFIEMGDGIAGYATGNFYAEPTPQVDIHPPGPQWFMAKQLYEKAWLRRWA